MLYRYFFLRGRLPSFWRASSLQKIYTTRQTTKFILSFVAVFAPWLRTLPDACIRDELGKIKSLKRHSPFIAATRMGMERKNRKNAHFLKGIKRHNCFIHSFIEEQSIGIAIIDFFLNRAHHCWESNYTHPDQLQPVKNSIKLY
jgi:hypothetical protein